LNLVADDKPGRPTAPALQVYASAVNAAYQELVGKNLTLTRPTDKSAPDKRGRTTGFGLDVMTTALQLVDTSMGPKQARTAIDRLTKQ
jgi:hypothetical protein